ncbi:MAG: PAS domain-containing protein [Candidatus Paracaedibacteraceae bacterium]|nr:PAS domain-containing protein [Candidatus Paracaedibacteraceae bacterium]
MVDERYKNGPGYKDFWNSLIQGKPVTSEFKRLKGDNSEIWLHAIYYPIKSCEGKITSIIKIAIEITDMKAKYYDNYLLLKKLDAINSRIPIIEFNTDGTIVGVNQSYLNIFGYELDEVINKKHEMFLSEYDVDSKEYQDFWDVLTSSQISEVNFLRIGKNGKKVLLKAIYYPILDENSKCNRIIKIATHLGSVS